MKSTSNWHLTGGGGRLDLLSVATWCLLFGFGIWIALGACWTDMAVQETFGWSPLGGVAAHDEGTTLDVSDEAISVTFRGTTPSFLDLQSDLAIALNAAFPFEALGMKPFLPLGFSQRLGLDGSDANHRWFVVAWLALPLAGLLVLALNSRQRCAPLIAFTALTVICNGLLAALQWFGVGGALDHQLGHRIVNALLVAMLLLALSLCAIAVAFAGWIAIRAKAPLRGVTKARTARVRICQAWLSAALMASLLGLSAKGALWLGWYTNDTRVNLLEPLALGAALVALALAIATELTIRLLWRSRARPTWRSVANTMWCVVIATVLATAVIPDPPQLANRTGEGEYILWRGNELVAYGDREASLREGFPRNLRQLTNSSIAMGSDARESQVRVSPSMQIVNFNSANLYSHLFGMPWLQLLLIVFVIGSLASMPVLSVTTLSALLSACILAARAGLTVVLAAALQGAILVILIALLGWLGISAIRSHAMDQVLVHARGDTILRSAFTALSSYRRTESSDYWRLPWDIIPQMYLQFDASFANLLRAEASVLHQIGEFGAADNLHFSEVSELKHRIRQVGWALQQRQSLFALCETFPDTLRFQLERYGFPKRLVDSAVASWTGELSVFRAPNLMRLRRLSAEADLLSALERIEDFWSVARPGMPPTFGRREQLREYVDKLAAIVDLKEVEIRHTRGLQSRLAWINGDLGVDSDSELRLVASQREVLSCLADADQSVEAAGRRFDAPALALECDAAMQRLEVVRSTVLKR